MSAHNIKIKYKRQNMNFFRDYNKSGCPIRWDAHSCPPLKPGSDLLFLNRYKKSGINFVSLNVGFDLNSQDEVLKLIDYYRDWIIKHDEEYMLVSNINSIIDCKETNKLGVAFDVEGCNVLDGNLEMVSQLYSMGVKQLVFAYNQNNISGGGCFDDDKGLTAYGKRLLQKCNDVGMVIDCSHLGYQTSMDVIGYSNHPVVFSHSNPFNLVNHPRNISDEQIKACADKGGVIGVNGIGIFLGNNNVSSEKIVEHIDYVVQKVGAGHVGIGLDCVFDQDEIIKYVKNNPDTFPREYGFDNVAIAQPEQFLEIVNILSKNGYSESDVNNILGDNFFRVAREVWK